MNESKQPPASKLSRRQAVAGAAGLGALAAAVVAVPLVRSPADTPAAAAAAGDAKKPGYQVTQHVLRYYETTRI